MFTSRAATEQLVRYLLAAIEADPLETTFREQTTQFSMDTDPEASRCPACQHQNDISARFCNECGSQLAQEA
jgi:predicted amidophosphoribosyltransferase